MPRLDITYLRGFKKDLKHESRQAIHMEKLLATVWVIPQVGGAWSQGITRASQCEPGLWRPSTASSC